MSQMLILTCLAFFQAGAEEPAAPKPFGLTPSERQIQWHALEFYAFIHFTVNTFTDKEWGYGDESPELFNPTAFDAEQIVLTCKEAGMKGLVLTTKHHDGFCLWPTETTEHNITKSPYKKGKGDIVREFVDACRKHGLEVGMYLSPWDRNHPEYGRPGYIKTFRAQLRELLTRYGKVFEVWFDGANGGTGYYGGAKENRKIDRVTYYDWETTFRMIRELQPGAVIFSDIGPDARWVGTEAGYSGDPCWHRYTPSGRKPGVPPANGQTKYWESLNGHREGDYWMPAETNTSIRPKWFYHASDDNRVKSPETLVKLHYDSIGHGTTLILNLPPDKRGLIHENDIKSLKEFKRIINATFSVDLAGDATFTASNVRGGSETYGTRNMRDKSQTTYWAADDEVLTPEIVVNFPRKTTFNVVNIREYIPLGQRIWGWALDSWRNETWVEFAKGESIGHRRLWKGNLQQTTKLRVRITQAAACPALTDLSVHLEPVRLTAPDIKRNPDGSVSISASGLIRYTTDGSEPSEQSPVYLTPIPMRLGGTVKSKAFYKGESSPTVSRDYTYTKGTWKIVSASSRNKRCRPERAIDDNAATTWCTLEEDPEREVIVDLGEELEVSAFSMTSPSRGTNKDALITNYEFHLSLDGTSWTLAGEGEFANIYNNPVKQRIEITPAKARFFKFKATQTHGGRIGELAEIGLIVK